MELPRHPNADPNCTDCDGYGYIHIDDIVVEVQTIGHYTEYAYEPVCSICHCTETILENKPNETSDRNSADYF